MRIGKTTHFWTHLPEIGDEYEFCTRCGIIRVRKTGERVSYNEALARATKKTESDNAKNS